MEEMSPEDKHEEELLQKRADHYGRPLEVQRMLEQRQEQALEETLANLKAGVEFYEKPRRPNDVDLVQMFRNELLKRGVDRLLVEDCYDASPLIVEARERQPHPQMFLINRWLLERLYILTQSGVDTRKLRFAVLNNIRVEDWIEVTMDHYVNMVIDYNLLSDHHG